MALTMVVIMAVIMVVVILLSLIMGTGIKLIITTITETDPPLCRIIWQKVIMATEQVVEWEMGLLRQPVHLPERPIVLPTGLPHQHVHQQERPTVRQTGLLHQRAHQQEHRIVHPHQHGLLLQHARPHQIFRLRLQWGPVAPGAVEVVLAEVEQEAEVVAGDDK